MHTLDHARNQGREEEYMMMMRQQQMGASQARPMEYPGWEYTPPEAYASQQQLVAQQPSVIDSLPPTITPIVQPGEDMYANMTEEQLMASLLQPESFQTDMQTLADQSALANALRTMSADDLAFT